MKSDKRGLLALGRALMALGPGGVAWAGAAPNDAFPGFSDAEMAGRHARVRAEMARRWQPKVIRAAMTVGQGPGHAKLGYEVVVDATTLASGT